MKITIHDAALIGVDVWKIVEILRWAWRLNFYKLMTISATFVQKVIWRVEKFFKKPHQKHDGKGLRENPH